MSEENDQPTLLSGMPTASRGESHQEGSQIMSDWLRRTEERAAAPPPPPTPVEEPAEEEGSTEIDAWLEKGRERAERMSEEELIERRVAMSSWLDPNSGELSKRQMGVFLGAQEFFKSQGESEEEADRLAYEIFTENLAWVHPSDRDEAMREAALASGQPWDNDQYRVMRAFGRAAVPITTRTATTLPGGEEGISFNARRALAEDAAGMVELDQIMQEEGGGLEGFRAGLEQVGALGVHDYRELEDPSEARAGLEREVRIGLSEVVGDAIERTPEGIWSALKSIPGRYMAFASGTPAPVARPGATADWQDWEWDGFARDTQRGTAILPTVGGLYRGHESEQRFGRDWWLNENGHGKLPEDMTAAQRRYLEEQNEKLQEILERKQPYDAFVLYETLRSAWLKDQEEQLPGQRWVQVGSEAGLEPDEPSGPRVGTWLQSTGFDLRLPRDDQLNRSYASLVEMWRRKDELGYSDGDIATRMQLLQTHAFPSQDVRDWMVGLEPGRNLWTPLEAISRNEIIWEMRKLAGLTPMGAHMRAIGMEQPQEEVAMEAIATTGKFGQTIGATTIDAVDVLTFGALESVTGDFVGGVRARAGTDAIKQLRNIWISPDYNWAEPGDKMEAFRGTYEAATIEELDFELFPMPDVFSEDFQELMRRAVQTSEETWSSQFGNIVAHISTEVMPGQSLADYIATDGGAASMAQLIRRIPIGSLPEPIRSAVVQPTEIVGQQVQLWDDIHVQHYGRLRSGLAEGLQDIVTDTVVDGTGIWERETKLGWFMRVPGGVANEVIAEAGFRLLIDPIAELATSGGYERQGANTSFLSNVLYGLDPTTSGWGAGGRAMDLGFGLGLDESSRIFKALHYTGRLLDFMAPWETALGQGIAYPARATGRAVQSTRMLPGAPARTVGWSLAPQVMWRGVAPVVDGKRAAYPGINAALGEIAYTQVKDNLARGRHPYRGVSRYFHPIIDQALQRGGFDSGDAKAAFGKDARKIRERYFTEMRDAVHDTSDATKMVRSSPVFQRMMERIDLMAAEGRIHDGGLRRPNLKNQMRAVVEHIAIHYGRLGGIPAIDKALTEMESRFFRAPETRFDEVDARQALETWRIPGDGFTTVREAQEISRDTGAQMPFDVFNSLEAMRKMTPEEASRYPYVERVEDVNFSDKSVEHLVQLLVKSPFDKEGRVVAELLRRVVEPHFDLSAHRVQAELGRLVDAGHLQANKAKDLLHELKQMNETYQFSAQPPGSVVREGRIGDVDLRGHIGTEAYGREAILRALADLRDQPTGIDDRGFQILAALVLSLPEDVLQRIKLVNRLQVLQASRSGGVVAGQMTTVDPAFSPTPHLYSAISLFRFPEEGALPSVIPPHLKDVSIDDMVQLLAKSVRDTFLARTEDLHLDLLSRDAFLEHIAGALDGALPGDRAVEPWLKEAGEIYGVTDPEQIVSNKAYVDIVSAVGIQLADLERHVVSARRIGDVVSADLVPTVKGEPLTLENLGLALDEALIDALRDLPDPQGHLADILSSPDTIRTYLGRQVSSRIVDSINKYSGEVSYHGKQVGQRVYQFIHELGHAVTTSFLSDAEVKLLTDAYLDELRTHGLKDSPDYVHKHEYASSHQFQEWFAEQFAEYVLFHKIPESIERSPNRSRLLRLFDEAIQRLERFFNNWFYRDPRIEEDFHPVIRDVVDRLFAGKAEQIRNADEIALRHATWRWERFTETPDTKAPGRAPEDTASAQEAADKLRADAEAEVAPPVEEPAEARVRVALTEYREEYHEYRALGAAWIEARDKMEGADAESRPKYAEQKRREFEEASERLFSLMLPRLNQAIQQGLPEGAIRIENMVGDALEQAESITTEGRKASSKPVFYLDLVGDPDIIAGRLAEFSEAAEQDLMIVREAVSNITAETKGLDGDALIDFLTEADPVSGVERLATAVIELPIEMERSVRGRLMKALVNHSLKIGRGSTATIRPTAGPTGNTLIEIAYVPVETKIEPQYGSKVGLDPVAVAEGATRLWREMFAVAHVDMIHDLLHALSKKMPPESGIIKLDWVRERISVSRPAPKEATDVRTDPRYYGYHVDRGTVAEAAITGELREGVAGDIRVERGRPADPGGEELPPVSGVPEPRAALTAEQRAVLRRRDLVDSGRISDQLLEQDFHPSEEVPGGRPHKMFDQEIRDGLDYRVANSSLTPFQRDFLLENVFGEASTLVDVTRTITLTVPRAGGPSVRVEYPIQPLTKDGYRIDLPGGLEGKFSFSDSQYLGKRPIDSKVDWREKLKADFDKRPRRFPVDPDSLSAREFAELDARLTKEYDRLVQDIIAKLHRGYGLDGIRPDPKKYFNKKGSLLPGKAEEYRQLMEIFLMDIASLHTFSFLSKQTNLFENQLMAAIARPRSMLDLMDITHKYKIAKDNKGVPLDRNEANMILGFAATRGRTFVDAKFGDKDFVDVSTDLLPVAEVRDWTEPGGPKVRITTDRLGDLNAKTMEDFYLKAEYNESQARKALQKAVDAGADAESIGHLERDLTEASLFLHAAAERLPGGGFTAKLTGDYVSTHTDPPSRLLDLYSMMEDDFQRVLSGDQPYSWFEKHPGESWESMVDRITAGSPGMASKITSFGSYWQAPLAATIGAVDIHMVALLAPDLLKKGRRLHAEGIKLFDQWRSGKSAAELKKFRKSAEKRLGKKAPKEQLDDAVKELQEKAVAERVDWTFNQFLENRSSNPARSYWLEPVRKLLTDVDKIRLFPMSAKPVAELFEGNIRVDSKAMQLAKNRQAKIVREAPPEKKKTEQDKLNRVTRALYAHKQMEAWRELYGAETPGYRATEVAVLSKGKESELPVMSEEYKKILKKIGTKARRAAGSVESVATMQHAIWDKWRGYIDPHVIVSPGSTMLPVVRTAAWRAMVDAFEDMAPWMKDPRYSDILTGRVSGIDDTRSASLRGLRAEGQRAGFLGRPEFKDKPLPSRMRRGALYTVMDDEGRVPTSVRDLDAEDFEDVTVQIQRFFQTGDVNHLMQEIGRMMAVLMVRDYPQARDFLIRRFDSFEGPDGIHRISSRGMEEIADAFRYYWKNRTTTDGEMHGWFDRIKRALGDIWRRNRTISGEFDPDVRRFFDEMFDIADLFEQEAVVRVQASDLFKEYPTITLRTGEEFEEPVTKRGRKQEALRIDMRKDRVQKALGVKEGVTEYRADELLANAARHVITEHARLKFGENVMRITTRSVVPLERARVIEKEVAARMAEVFGDPKKLAAKVTRVEMKQPRLDEMGDLIRDPETGRPIFETITDPVTGEPLTVEVFDNIDEATQRRMHTLIHELAADPIARPLVPKWMLVPEEVAEFETVGLSRISTTDYLLLQEALKDAESGIGAGRMKRVESMATSAGYAAWHAVVSTVERVPGIASISQGMRKAFKVMEPFEAVRTVKGEKVQTVWTRGGYVSPEIRELWARLDAELAEIPQWLIRIQLALQNKSPKASAIILLDSMRGMLTPPIDPTNLRRAYSLHSLFGKVEEGRIPNLEQLEVFMPDVISVLADGRKMTKGERVAINTIKDWISESKRTGEVELDLTSRAAIGDAIDIVWRGLNGRIAVAEMRIGDIVKSLGGSPDKGTHVGLLVEQDKSWIYNSFYAGDWNGLFKWAARQGFEIGTRPDKAPGYNARHAAIEMVVRLRGREIMSKFTESMAQHGIRTKIEDLTERLSPDLDRNLFMDRVLHYINLETQPGQSHLIYREGEGLIEAPPGFRDRQTARKTDDYPGGESIAGPERGAGLYPTDQRGSATRRYSTESGREYVHDAQAYMVAHEVLNEWGFKFGANTEDWVRTYLPDGSDAIVPKMVLDEIEASIDRIAGPGAFSKTAKKMAYGTGRLPKRIREKLDELRRDGTSVTKGAEAPITDAPGHAFNVQAEVLAGDVLTYIMNVYPMTYTYLRMGVTCGIGIPNPHYYQGITIGGLFQIYQKMGIGVVVGKDGVQIRGGLLGAMSHPKMAGAVAARLWGESGAVLTPNAKPIITKDGRIFTTDMLVELSRRERLDTSFVKSLTSRGLAEDLRRREPGFWNKMMAGPRWWQGVLVQSATSIDNLFRQSVFIDELVNGKSVAAAADMARAAMFDYGKLTDFEKKWMRSTMIFYAFTRKNLDQFWDTLLTNPHRIMGQLRLMRGINEHYLEGDPQIVESPWTQGRLGVYFKDAAIGNLFSKTQKVRWVTAPLPVKDAIGLQFEMYDFSNFFFEEELSARNDAVTRMIARMNPLIQMPLVMGMSEDIFRGRGLGREIIPYSVVEMDLNATGGIFVRDVLGARPVPLTREEKAEYPGQAMVWVATNKRAYWLWRNAIQMPMPVMQMRDESILGKIPGIGPALEMGPPGYILRTKPIKSVMEGTIGWVPTGRGVDTFQQLDRADIGFVETNLWLAEQLREHRAAAGYEEARPPAGSTRIGEEDSRLFDQLPRGAEPRIELGPSGERLGIFFRPQLIPTEEAAIQHRIREWERESLMPAEERFERELEPSR
jgi:hypothetical protein